jgi:hypothetical protein
VYKQREDLYIQAQTTINKQLKDQSKIAASLPFLPIRSTVIRGPRPSALGANRDPCRASTHGGSKAHASSAAAAFLLGCQTFWTRPAGDEAQAVHRAHGHGYDMDELAAVGLHVHSGGRTTCDKRSVLQYQHYCGDDVL